MTVQLPARRVPAWAWLTLLAALVLIVHWPRLSVGYVWDDLGLIANNASLQQNPFSAFNEPLFQNTRPDELYYHRPLAFFLLSLAGNAGSFQPPTALSILQLAVMLAATGVCFRLFRTYFSDGIAAALTALFAVFPSNVEAVAWFSALPDLLALLFLVLFITNLQTAPDRLSPRPSALAWLALALLSKEGAVAGVVIALLADIPRLRERPSERLFRFHLPIWLVTWSYLVLRSFWVQKFPDLSLDPALVFRTAGAYAWKVIDPWPLSILIGDRLGTWDAFAFGGIATCGLLAVALLRASSPAVRLGAAMFAGGLAPYANIVLPPGENYLIAERYMMPMLLGVLLLLGAAVASLRRPAPALAAIAVLTVLYGVTSHQQYGVWQNPRRMWSQVIEAYPTKVGPYYRRAKIEVQAGDLDAAQADVNEAERLLDWWFREYHMGFHKFVRKFTYQTAAAVAFDRGEYALSVTHSRQEYLTAGEPAAVEMGIVALDHLLDYDAALGAALRANAAFPSHVTLANMAITLAIAGGRPQLAWTVVNRSSYHHAAYAEGLSQAFAATATAATAERGMWIYAHTRMVSPAFRLFAAAVTAMTPQQRATVAGVAYAERLWAASDFYYARALAGEPRPQWAVARGFALIKLGRKAEACAAWAGVAEPADPDLKAALGRLHDECTR